jgi:hypothetical protein
MENLGARFAENIELLSSDAQRIHKYNDDLSGLLSSIQLDKAEFLRSKEHQQQTPQKLVAPMTPSSRAEATQELADTIEFKQGKII